MALKKFTEKNKGEVITHDDRYKMSWDIREDDDYHRLLNDGLTKGYIRKADGTDRGGYEMLLLDYPATDSSSEKYYYSRPKAFEVAKEEGWVPLDVSYEDRMSQLQWAIMDNYMLTQSLMNHISPFIVVSVTVQDIDTAARITKFDLIRKGKMEKTVKFANKMAIYAIDELNNLVKNGVLDKAQEISDLFDKAKE